MIGFADLTVFAVGSCFAITGLARARKTELAGAAVFVHDTSRALVVATDFPVGALFCVAAVGCFAGAI